MNANLAKLYRRRDEVLTQLDEIDARETAANRDCREHEDYKRLFEERTLLNGQIEVGNALEAERQQRQSDREEGRGRGAGTGLAAGNGSGAPEDRSRPQGGFRSLGEQLQAICRSSIPGNAFDPRLAELRAPTGLNEGVGEQGGFLVQTDMSTEIWRRVFLTGQILSRVRRIPISTHANGVKLPYLKGTSRVAGSRYGGVQVYRRAEADTVTATKPLLGEWKLELESGMALVYLTEEIMADAPQLEALVMQIIPEEIAVFTEDEIINGNGVGKPLGVVHPNCLATVSVAKESGQPAGTIVPMNIAKMDSRIWAPSLPGSVWFMNQDTKPALNLMTLPVGTGGVPVYMPASGISGSPFGTLYGRPVVPIEHASTLGTVGDIFSADFSQYALIEKGGIKTASSIHVRFLYGENVLRFMWRNNGAPMGGWIDGPLTPAKGSSTQSPFVTLATRA